MLKEQPTRTRTRRKRRIVRKIHRRAALTLLALSMLAAFLFGMLTGLAMTGSEEAGGTVVFMPVISVAPEDTPRIAPEDTGRPTTQPEESAGEKQPPILPTLPTQQTKATPSTGGNEEEPSVEAVALARLLWGEARGVPSQMEQAAVVWCVLNRVDAAQYPDTIMEVVEQKGQFTGYKMEYPVMAEFVALAEDVLRRWRAEKTGETDVGRVLPKQYVFFTGRDGHNHFRDAYRSGEYWDWSAQNPYSD